MKVGGQQNVISQLALCMGCSTSIQAAMDVLRPQRKTTDVDYLDFIVPDGKEAFEMHGDGSPVLVCPVIKARVPGGEELTWRAPRGVLLFEVLDGCDDDMHGIAADLHVEVRQEDDPDVTEGVVGDGATWVLVDDELVGILHVAVGKMQIDLLDQNPATVGALERIVRNWSFRHENRRKVPVERILRVALIDDSRETVAEAYLEAQVAVHKPGRKFWSPTNSPTSAYAPKNGWTNMCGPRPPMPTAR